MIELLKKHPILIAGLAVTTRLALILIFPGANYFEAISQSYLHVAENILAGRGIVVHVDIAPLADGVSLWSFEPFIDRPLGYLFLIFLPYAIFSSPVAIQLLHALLAGCSALLLQRIGSQIASPRAGTTAGLLYALWPLSARFEIAILPDSVMSFFLLATLWLLLKDISTQRAAKWSLLGGLVCGIGMTMRPDILLLPFFLLIPYFCHRDRRRGLRAAVLLVAGAGLVLGAHTARNYAVTGGKVVPLGLGNGISLWEGISQFGDTLGTLYGDERVATLEGYRTWAYPNGVERDRRRFREAVEIILEHPLWYAGVVVKRIPVLLTPDWIMTRKFAPSLREFLDEVPNRTIVQYVAAHPLPSVIRGLLILLQYGTLLLAFVAAVKGRTEMLLLFPTLIISYYIVIHIPTNTEARYFYPALPFVLLLASHGWELLKRPARAA